MHDAVKTCHPPLPASKGVGGLNKAVVSETLVDPETVFKKARSKLNSTARPCRRTVVDPSSHYPVATDLVNIGVPSDPYE